MIEAMACGTPVIAWRNGSVPEVMEDGVTGFVVDDTDEAVRAVERAVSLSRTGCRRAFERRYSVGRMARDYVAIYRRLLEGQGPGADGRRRPLVGALAPPRKAARPEAARLRPGAQDGSGDRLRSDGRR
jgi:hypothetical protein